MPDREPVTAGYVSVVYVFKFCLFMFFPSYIIVSNYKHQRYAKFLCLIRIFYQITQYDIPW
jgi:hypothetical protein